jgi:cell division protease FtsH
VPDVSLFVNTVQPLVDKYNVESTDGRIDYDYKPVGNQAWLLSMIPYVIVVGFGIFLFISFRRSMNGLEGRNGMGFGKARVKNPNDERRKTTFADVAATVCQLLEVDYAGDGRSFAKECLYET